MTVPDYVTLAETKAAWPDNTLGATTAYDALATSLITRCSRQWDKWTNRKPGAYAVATDSTQYFDAPDGGVSVVPNDNRLSGSNSGTAGRLYVGELAAVPTSVSVSTSGSVTTYTALAATDYLCGPWNALDDGRPYQWLQLDYINGANASWYGFPKGIKVIGKFGYATTVPDDVKVTVITMVIRLLRRAQQNYQETGVLLDSGQVMQGMKIEEDVNEAIKHYRKLAI